MSDRIKDQDPPREYLELDEWRSVTLDRVMWIGFPLAVLTALPYVYFSLSRGLTLQGMAGIPSSLAVVLAAIVKRPYRFRALCLVVVPYWLGLVSMFMKGTLSLFYLLAFVMAVVVLMGPGWAYGAIVLDALTLLVGGRYSHWQPTLAGIDTSQPVTWMIITLNFICVATVIAVGCGSLLKNVEGSLKAQKIAAQSVDLRQQEITRLKKELAEIKTGIAIE
jgi:hypothetical protein